MSRLRPFGSELICFVDFSSSEDLTEDRMRRAVPVRRASVVLISLWRGREPGLYLCLLLLVMRTTKFEMH